MVVHISCNVAAALLSTIAGFICLYASLLNTQWTTIETSNSGIVTFSPYGYCISGFSTSNTIECFTYYVDQDKLKSLGTYTNLIRQELKAWNQIGYSKDSWCTTNAQSKRRGDYTFLSANNVIWCSIFNSSAYMIAACALFFAFTAACALTYGILLYSPISSTRAFARSCVIMACALCCLALLIWDFYTMTYIRLVPASSSNIFIGQTKYFGSGVTLLIVAIAFFLLSAFISEWHISVQSKSIVVNSSSEEKSNPLEQPAVFRV